MNPTYHTNIDQGTDEWHAIRCGLLTASAIKLIMTPTCKPANNDKSRAHAYDLAAQRITRYTEPSYVNDDMLRGHADEIYARELYSEKYAPVTECGFITSQLDGVSFGYSPDGLVGINGLIEIKSRRQKFQIETIVKNAAPMEYVLQIQFALLITGREWCDFISYCGGLPMFVCRVYPDPAMHAAIMEAAQNFEAQVASIISEYEATATQYPQTNRVDYGVDIQIN